MLFLRPSDIKRLSLSPPPKRCFLFFSLYFFGFKGLIKNEKITTEPYTINSPAHPKFLTTTTPPSNEGHARNVIREIKKDILI
jgi:hypothetical protein